MGEAVQDGLFACGVHFPQRRKLIVDGYITAQRSSIEISCLVHLYRSIGLKPSVHLDKEQKL